MASGRDSQAAAASTFATATDLLSGGVEHDGTDRYVARVVGEAGLVEGGPHRDVVHDHRVNRWLHHGVVHTSMVPCRAAGQAEVSPTASSKIGPKPRRRATSDSISSG